jgi:hypothetical protein
MKLFEDFVRGVLNEAMFEAPPEIVSEVYNAFVRIYAGHVLGSLEEKLGIGKSSNADNAKIEKKMIKFFNAMDKLLDGTRQRGAFVTFGPVAPGSDWNQAFKINPIKSWSGDLDPGFDFEIGKIFKDDKKSFQVSSMGEVKLDYEDEIVARISDVNSGQRGQETTYEDVRYFIEAAAEKEKENLSSKEEPESGMDQSLAKDYMRYLVDLSNGKKKKYKSRARKTIKLNFDNWKYLDIKPFKGKQLGGTLTLSLIFQPRKSVVGTWDFMKNVLELDIPKQIPMTIQQFKSILREVNTTIRHEVQHVTQDAADKFGLPSRKMSDPRYEGSGLAYKGGGKQDYYLRDVEFYPHIADAIDRFKNAKEALGDSATEDRLRRLADDIVGKVRMFQEIKKAIIKLQSQGNEDLAKSYELRLKKAYKEFYRGISE